MTKNEAYKSFKCFHCVFLDRDEGICTAGDSESDDCKRYEDDEWERINDRE